jgi:7-cyano-7-deazaguanine reductase
MYDNKPELKGLTLGRQSEYASEYSPDLLQAVPRSLNRQELGVVDSQPFVGEDVWHAYELSWLNTKGKPVVALGRFSISSASTNIVESKSFKLYLNSFNQSRFESAEKVRSLMVKDLSNTADGDFTIELFSPDQTEAFPVSVLPGDCIDDIDIEVPEFSLKPQALKLTDDQSVVTETLHSHLLKSNCLITNQPDWASVVIEYTGVAIDQESLLSYLVSFRMHNEFHEQCVERIFCDISQFCQPKELSVQALYTRRGGLDINPFRSSKVVTKADTKNAPRRRINRQ